MHLLNNLRLGLRMALGFGSVLLLLALVVALAATRFGATERATDELVNETWVKAEAVNELENATRANGTRTLELLLTTDAARLAHVRERIEANRARATAAIATLDRLVRLPEGRRMLAEVVALRGRYVQSFRQVDAELAAGRREAALALVRQETLPLLEQLQERTRALAQRQDGMARQAGEAAQAGARSDRYAVLALGAAALVLGAVLALVLTRSVTVPLAEALAMARRIADGDLTASRRVQRRDEIGELLAAMGDMNDRLARVVGAVRGRAESVATASAQIAQGNLDLSQRTEEQASALEQTAASMEQLGSTVQHNAANAHAAHRLADDASAVAARGGDAVARVVGTMDEIQRGSQRIGDIIGTIDGIALQTNILALNAAVEAARAGEQGRGFAVVAGEVRSLAQRCAAAAREVKGLITANLEQVATGNAQVHAAGERMGDVVAAIRQVTQTVEQISAASSQQSAGVGQVGEAVGQMDQVTQQNAALVEQSAAAAESLRQQAEQLVGAVAAFRLQPDAAA